MKFVDQSRAAADVLAFSLALFFWLIATSDQTVSGQSGSPDPRPPELVVLETMEAGGGFGMELHRVSISGTARDSTGTPIPAAKVYVASHNSRSNSGFQKLRGQTIANEQGRFELVDVPLLINRNRPNPLPQPAEGGFVVFGVAQGYGITWAKEHDPHHPTK